ncbi:hypothetical protein TCAL_01663 [Tigriopus californicus]|uniref:SEC7 domain-containing protein n=1 Tax=Tigriopus californicus TaxID=6832 RepID=A0A553PA03_TIGCA|nr:IQ motif and SEC7 domain-containing protein 3-like [Tigriopus californicus]TRY74504.1 hypothetical protein TCAL_01663 [Tigriopus californicus]|eukprot:TCALIF_01663-PA protein Name:"Similar to IQSEC1 IQ motif and SEC7 domain-containing protein 1 (Homo sapiens)" AED:0.32 eAED:0.32 QI:0/0/0/1/1/1/4/0/947
MERYQLSADFAEKQLQVLERKYGGEQRARQAALTIQRAFRRYSMAKKFADLTAHAKIERRISRPLDYPRISVAGSSAAATAVSHFTTAAGGAHRSHHEARHHWPHSRAPPGHYQYHNPKCVHRQRIPPGTVLESGPSSSSSSPGSRPLVLTHQASEGGLVILQTNDGSGGDANSSCPDIQSFPLDETCVYSHSPYSTRQGSPHQVHPLPMTHKIMLSVRSSSLQRDDPNTPTVKKSNSGSSPHATGPHVPRRTVSRLTSLDDGLSAKMLSVSSSGPSLSGAQTYPILDSSLPVVPSPAFADDTDSGGSRRAHRRAPHAHHNLVHLHNHHHHQQQQQQLPTSPQSASQSQHLVPGHHPGLNSSGHGTNLSSPAGSGGSAGGGSPSVSASSGTTLLYRSSDANTYTVNEVLRKRHYRTGLNIFNKKPEKGIAYLIRRGFLENSPQAVARFLITRKGLSKQMIGEYLGTLHSSFNMSTLDCFASEMDFCDLQVDIALRKFQTYFRMPGEAQKIERLMQVFSDRYCECNPETIGKFHEAGTIFILAFAIILLNTDLHTPSLKPEKRMKVEDFIRNLRGVDNNHDVDPTLLTGIYDRIRSHEFRPGSDHVTQVMKVQQTIVAKCPNLAVPHRRLVCYCRLYEVLDPQKKERPGIHQREVFLFNDILVMTKIHSRKKNSVTYAFRQSYLLAGMVVTMFQTQFYPFGIKIAQKWDGKTILMLNARNEHDRSKFVEDLKESIAEMDELETIRLESELEKHRHSKINETCDHPISPHRQHQQQQQQQQQQQHQINLGDSPKSDSSLANGKSRSPSTHYNNNHHQHHPYHHHNAHLHHHHHNNIINNNNESSNHNMNHRGGTGSMASNGVQLRRSAINNSLLDLTEGTAEKMTRRGSVGSLDSGMSISFQSNSVGSFCIGNGNASGGRREERRQNAQGVPGVTGSGTPSGHKQPSNG